MAENVNLNKEVFNKRDYTKTISTTFTQLDVKTVQEQIDEQPTVQEFFNLGFQNIHLVDLDGALKNKLINENIIKEICKIKKVKIQVGGGVRSLDHIKKLLEKVTIISIA